MLELSRTLNPECEHIQGDMRTLRLGRTFDAVLRARRDRVHDDRGRPARGDRDRCRCTSAPAGRRCSSPTRPASVRSRNTDHGGHDGETAAASGTSNGRTIRDPGRHDYEVDFAVLAREAGKPTRVEHDRHAAGSFPKRLWRPADRAGRPRARGAGRRGPGRRRARGVRRAQAGLTPSEKGSTLC